MSAGALIIGAAVIGSAYLVGSIPFGVLFSRLGGGADPRRGGSGNIGATNVWRISGKAAALATLIGDMGKGFAAVYGTGVLAPAWTDVAGIAVMVGHMFPCWLAGRGGKGVATAAGVLFAFDAAMGAVAVGLWIAVFLGWRISSLAALVAALVTPLFALEWARDRFVTVAGIMVMIGWRHIPNLRRLLRGEEAAFKGSRRSRGFRRKMSERDSSDKGRGNIP